MEKRAKLLKTGAWFFLLYGLVLLIVASRYFQYLPSVNSFLTGFFIVIHTVAHFELLSFAAYVLLYVTFVNVFPYRKFAWIWTGVVSGLIFAFLIFDSVVFSLYRFHINGFVLSLVFGGGFSNIFQFSLSQYALVIGGLLAVLALFLFLSRKFFALLEKRKPRHGVVAAVVLAAMLISAQFIHAWADAASYTPITKSARFYPLSFPLTARKMMYKMGIVDKLRKDNVQSFADEDQMLDYPKAKLKMSTDSRTNIVFIFLDSWYFKSFDSITQPNIYRFSKRCEVFDMHYSGSNGTRTGVFSAFYSIPGLYWDEALASNRQSIFVDALQMNHYDIKTFTSATLTDPPFDKTVFSRVPNLRKKSKGDEVWQRDQNITSDWLTMMNGRKSKHPLFGFLFYDALHGFSHPKNYCKFQPEWDHPKYEELSNNANPAYMLNLYKNAASFIDDLVGRVLKDMESRGMMKNTWIVITGDHAQEFNDNHKNYWGHNGNYSAAQMHVPFMIYRPDCVHKVYRHWTSHYDIAPTIFQEVFRCANPPSDYSVGRDIHVSEPARRYLVVGSRDNFAILTPHRITSVDFQGSYDVTDEHLNEINEPINTKLLNEAMASCKRFCK